MRSSIFNFDGLIGVARAVVRGWRFSVPLALLGAAALAVSASVLRSVFETPNFQTMALAALSPKTEVLAFGSSRVFFGIDPRRYERPTVNLAATYLDLASAERLWRRYSPRASGVKAVLIELDVATLLYDTRIAAPYGLGRLGLETGPDAADFVRDFDGSVHALLGPFFRWRLTPEFFRTEEQYTGLGQEPQDAVPGYVPSELKVAFPKVVAETKFKQAAELIARMPLRTRERNLAALVRLLDDLARRQVRVALVRFPVEPEGRLQYPASLTIEVDRALAELRVRVPSLAAAAAAGEGRRWDFWDFSNDPGFTSSDFRDPDHLNQNGAARLAPLLEARLDSLLQ